MRAGAAWLRWWAVVSVAAVLATGCATVPGPPGAGDTYSHRRGVAGEAPADEAWPLLEPSADSVLGRRARVRLQRRQGSPTGWPDWEAGDEELLAPLLASTSVADFLELQRGVDMARLVERLEDWNAVRLGAQGPLDARASEVLTRKRAAFLLTVTSDYGAVAEVFALFIIHTAFDDEVHQLLQLLASQKQLKQTLGHLEAVRGELERRGLKLSEYRERGEQAGDVLRGLGSAARDALNSSYASDGGRFDSMWQKSRQLPPAYQQALYEMGRAQTLEHYAPGRAALGSVDQMTFGVPLGFYHLVAGTVHGVGVLTQGQYEQATRELAPAGLLVALYAGGKAGRVLGEGRTTGGGGRLALPEVGLEALKGVAQRLGEQLGVEGLGELARYIRASREAAVFVGAGGEPAALALYEARGSVPKAQAWLSQAKEKGAGPGGVRASGGKGLGGLATLVDEPAGHTLEVVQAKLVQAELEAAGPRLPADVVLLRKLNTTLETPAPGVSEGYVLWNEYVSYRQRRLTELEQGRAVEGPLRWEAYERMRGAFARGMVFERAMVSLLREDAALPPAQRRWLRDFLQPRIELHVGVSKPGTPGIRFADVLVIEERPPAGQPARVETFSFKSRNLAPLGSEDLKAQMRVDARAALDYYGGTLDILRSSLKRRVHVQHVRLIYEGGKLLPRLDDWKVAVDDLKQRVKGVEVLVQ